MIQDRSRRSILCVPLLAALAALAALPVLPVLPLTAAAQTDPTLHFSRVRSGALEADTSSSPSASWIDVDMDGDEDLYVLNGYGSLEDPAVPQPNVLYRNDGGIFTPIPEHPLVRHVTFSGSATWGDYDNDGHPDVFVANQRDAENVLYRNDGDGGFTRVVEGPVAEDRGRSFSAAWVDVDVDGLLDLYVANGRSGGGQGDFLYRNLGGGRFARVGDAPFVRDSLPSGGGTWGDFDADGDPDLFLPVNSGEPNRLYRNDGDWTFTEIGGSMLGVDPLPGSPQTSVAHWVDVDNDGHLDLFVGNTGGTIDFLYRNDGEGRLERVTAGRVGLDATYVSDALWADLDNDGDLDLVIAVWGGASEVYRNDGTGRLHPAQAGGFDSVVHFASSVSASDIDDDGDLDLLFTQWPINEAGGVPNQLYRNETRGGNWLRVALEGTDSNRSAIGATVRVTARIRGQLSLQTRHVGSRTSWRSADGPVQHFGLGDAGEVDRVEVTWPSGREETLEGPIAANRTVRIVEGEGRDRREADAGPPSASSWTPHRFLVDAEARRTVSPLLRSSPVRGSTSVNVLGARGKHERLRCRGRPRGPRERLFPLSEGQVCRIIETGCFSCGCERVRVDIAFGRSPGAPGVIAAR